MANALLYESTSHSFSVSYFSSLGYLFFYISSREKIDGKAVISESLMLKLYDAFLFSKTVRNQRKQLPEEL